MRTKSNAKIVKTQMRFTEDIYNYITKEASRLGMAKNAVLVKIIDEYRNMKGQTEIEPLSRS